MKGENKGFLQIPLKEASSLVPPWVMPGRLSLGIWFSFIVRSFSSWKRPGAHSLILWQRALASETNASVPFFIVPVLVIADLQTPSLL
jgi:hypothetical protein